MTLLGSLSRLSDISVSESAVDFVAERLGDRRKESVISNQAICMECVSERSILNSYVCAWDKVPRRAFVIQCNLSGHITLKLGKTKYNASLG